MGQVQVSNNMVHLRNYKQTRSLLSHPQPSCPPSFIGHLRVGSFPGSVKQRLTLHLMYGRGLINPVQSMNIVPSLRSEVPTQVTGAP